MLARAYQILQGDLCKQCGLPKHICQNDDPDIQFQFHTEVCYATKAREKYEDAEEKKRSSGRRNKEAKAPAGEAVSPIPYLISGREMSTLRDPFREAQDKVWGAMVESRPKPRG